MKNKKVASGGMGFISTLTLILTVLKLFNLISISWIWVFSPIWISAVALLLIFSFIMIAGRIKKGKW